MRWWFFPVVRRVMGIEPCRQYVRGTPLALSIIVCEMDILRRQEGRDSDLLIAVACEDVRLIDGVHLAPLEQRDILLLLDLLDFDSLVSDEYALKV